MKKHYIFQSIVLTIILLMAPVMQSWAWDGTTKTAPDMSANNGTSEALAIQITKPEELAWLGDQMRLGNTATGKTYGNKYWKLMNDIDLGGKPDFSGNDWASMIGNTGSAFCGYFDGNNKTVSNIQVDAVTSTKYYGLFTSIQGKSTTDLSTVHDLKINHVYFQATTVNMAANTRLGGLAGYVKQANITNVTISDVNFTYTSDANITNTNQLGGAIGCMENNTTLTNVDVTGVTATFSKTTTGLYVGGIVGASTGTANTNSMTGCDAKTVNVTHSNNITGTTHMGGLVGNANTSLNAVNTNTVNGFTVNVSSDTGSAKTLYAGGLFGYCKGTGQEIKGNSASNVTITTAGTVNDVRLAGFIGSADGTGGLVSVKNNTATTVSITSNGTTAGTNYLGGFIAYTKGKSSPNERVLIQGNTVTSPTVAMNGIVGNSFYEGGLLGYADEHVNLYNNKVTTPAITIANAINAETYVGGAVGRQNKNTIIDGMTVSGGSISGPASENKQIKNNVVFFVGGFIGQQNSSGATPAFVTNKFMNVAVSNMTINLGKYVPAGVINNHKFAVGGIAGSVNAPNKDANGLCGMPENIIFKGGSIYAPYAATSPTVPNFNSGTAAHSNLTTEDVKTIDALDKAKVKTWYYSDYELGLSADMLSNTGTYESTPTTNNFRRNYKADATINEIGGIKYLTVNNSTFQNQNRYQDNLRDSWTVLWWTTQNSWAAGGATAALFTNEEQPIYPQYNFGTVGTAELTKFPYYMYFYQGVANANYVTSAVATKIIEGIEANKTQAAAANPVTLTISNDKENERGFDQRTISVAAKTLDAEGNVVDASGITGYQWYVNGVAKSNGTSIKLTPHWKEGQGITVNALNGTTVVATTTYTLAPGVLKTKAGSTGKVRSDINARGTKDNPYIIDCESALRQWSYLSTTHTATLWEGIVKPVAPFPTNQTAGHYNRAYYELGADITMGDDPFTPISHVGYGGDGTWGTYKDPFIFQGNFDGKGHKISGLKITWGAGQYNGNNTNIYYGLFGSVGNTAGTAAAVIKWGESAASNTVIKNLVIDGATLTHDVNNTTFSYRKDYGHITSDNGNNCMVGVLAGVVGGYTTIQNIEIRDSKITESTTTDYSLAKMGLHVGGAIGSVQCAYNQTGNVPTGTDIQHIVAQVDISLEHPKFDCEYKGSKAAGELGLFNVGGIIGRYIATSATQAQMQAIMPKYTLYSGTIKAEKAWISPVLGALRYKDQNGVSFNNYSKHWEGNNASAPTQITITNALYYNFKIGEIQVTEEYPSNLCGLGARAILLHTDGSDDENKYKAQSYQGVNYGATYIASKGVSLELLNKERTDGYSIVWDAESGTFMHLTTDTYVELSLSRAKDTDDNYTNAFTAVMEGADPAPTTYKWEVSFNGNYWHKIDDVTSDEYTVPVSLKTKYVRVSTTINEKTYTSLIDIVEADKGLCSPKITKVAGTGSSTFTFNLNQKSTVPDGQFSTSYQWYSTNKDNGIINNETAQTLTLSNDMLSSYNNVVWCKAIVSELGEEIETYFLISGATVVYVNGNEYTGNSANAGDDTNDGTSPQTPVKTIDKANSLLKSVDDGGTMDNNVIVIMGTLNSDGDFRSTGKNPATLTGIYDGIDYEGVIKIKQIDLNNSEHSLNTVNESGKMGSNCYILGDTKFQYLTFECNDKTKGNNFIECHGRDVTFGKGLVMTNFRNLGKDHGNLNMLQNIPEFTIVLTATNLGEKDIKAYTNRTKPQVVTIESGHYGRIMGGRYTNGFFAKEYNTSHTILGSAEHPVWAIVNIDIDKDNPNKGMVNRHEAPKGEVKDNYTCDINCIIAGLTDGSMYGDYQINVHGGRIGYIVGGNQGNPVPNGNAVFKNPGVDDDEYNKTWGQWPNSTYFGRTVINVEQGENLAPIKIDNVYAGGLGRERNGSDATTTVVDMYLYGRTEVNMKSGTVLGNIYGGGAGGVLGLNPWDVHVPYASTEDEKVSDAIMNKVQYGKFGDAEQKSDDQIAKVTLHNLNASGVYETELLDLGKSSTTLNITGGTINGSIYGGGYGYVSNMPFEVTMQGVGSVFGTTNVNISGGTIDGSVYGGSQGHSFYFVKKNNYGQIIDHIAEMNGTVNMHIFGNPTINGDIYGAGQGIATSVVKATEADVAAGKAQNVGDLFNEEYLRIATTGNTELDGNGKYKSIVNITIDLDDDISIHNVYGGGKLGIVDGNTNVVFNSGQVNGNIYGGGKGEKGHLKKAIVNGTTNVTIGY